MGGKDKLVPVLIHDSANGFVDPKNPWEGELFGSEELCPPEDVLGGGSGEESSPEVVLSRGVGLEVAAVISKEGGDGKDDAGGLDDGEVSSQEISALVDELVEMKKASAFADQFYGSPWGVPPAPHGWRHDMQKWAEGKGLIKPIVTGTPGVNRGEYVGFTRKGELLQEELRKRGHTIVVSKSDG